MNPIAFWLETTKQKQVEMAFNIHVKVLQDVYLLKSIASILMLYAFHRKSSMQLALEASLKPCKGAQPSQASIYVNHVKQSL